MTMTRRTPHATSRVAELARAAALVLSKVHLPPRLALAAALAAWAGAARASTDPVDFAYWESVIAAWTTGYRISLTLTIVAGSLGIISAAIQSLKSNKKGSLTVVIGALVSIVTLVNTVVFDPDYRVLNRSINTARGLLRDISDLAANPIQTEQARLETATKIQQRIDELRKLRNQTTAQVAWNDGGLVGRALAQVLPSRSRPDWVNQKSQSDPSGMTLIATSQAKVLTAAKDEALARALEQARDVLLSGTSPETARAQLDLEALGKYLADSAHVQDTYFEYDQGRDLYQYSVRVRLDADTLRSSLRLFAWARQAPLPEGVSQAIVTASNDPGAVTYAAARSATYEALLDGARASTPPEVYKLFEEGRAARRRHDTEPAIKLLSEAVRRQPGFYMAWYNLGLADEQAGKLDEARRAYQAAARLEPQLKPRDPSIHNTLGWLLYRQKDYRAAAAAFEKALAIEPNHVKARQNLEAAKRNL